MDPITRTRGEELHPELWLRYSNWNRLLESRGLAQRMTQGGRSWTVQATLYARGRTSPGEPCRHNGVSVPLGDCKAHPLGLPVTNARPGYSWHNFFLALDVAPDDPNVPGYQPDYEILHPAWRVLLETAPLFDLAEGAEWRSFPDAPHFYPKELSRTPDDEVRALFADGGLRAVWRYASERMGVL